MFLIISSASYLLFLLGLWFPPVWGPFYSDRRFATIWTNLALNIAVVLLSIISKYVQRKWVALLAGVIAIAWLYAWAVNAAV